METILYSISLTHQPCTRVSTFYASCSCEVRCSSNQELSTTLREIQKQELDWYKNTRFTIRKRKLSRGK
jgi:hypothetical protein